MIGKRLFVFLACLFVVMIGYITLPVQPFYVERLGQAEGVPREAIVMHVALLTAVYPLGQLVFAPVWGRWSDQLGRKPLLLGGIAGYAAGQILFGSRHHCGCCTRHAFLEASCLLPSCLMARLACLASSQFATRA